MLEWLKKWLTPKQPPSPDIGLPPPAPKASIVEIPPVVPVQKSAPPLSQRRPKTLVPELANPHLRRPLIFDPALKQYDAYRAGEPRFTADDEAKRWFAIREEVLLHALMRIAQSESASHLILRGSLLLAISNRQLARRPGDLDWVVTPSTWTMTGSSSAKLLHDVALNLRGSMGSGDVPFVIPDEAFVMEDIWCYEKSPGKRLIVPWTCEDPTQNGTIQMDFVFGEQMPSPPTTLEFEIESGSKVQIQAATQAQSLAWKLLWLETDMHCQGKDLYDAVLLAESMALRNEILSTVTFAKTFEIADPRENWRGFTASSIQNWFVEWKHFQDEYPRIQGSVEDWKSRLITALASLFNELASWRHLKATQPEGLS